MEIKHVSNIPGFINVPPRKKLLINGHAFENSSNASILGTQVANMHTGDSILATEK